MGRVTVGGEAWPEVEVTIYRGEPDDALRLGFGVTAADGRVELLAEEATGPLWLVPGEYLVTAQSIGPPLEIAADCGDVRKTPLRITVSEGESTFTLDVPITQQRGRRG